MENEITLSNESIEKLSSVIAEKFFFGIERLCIDKDTGLLGLILQHHLEQIFKSQQREQANKKILKMPIGQSDLMPTKVETLSRVDVDAENRKWEKYKKERGWE